MTDTQTKAAKPAKEKKEKVKVSVAGIKADLQNGIDRNGIAEKYGLSKQDVKRIFEHPDLKGLKVKPAPGFVFVEDGAEATSTATATSGTGDANLKEAALASAETGEKKGVW